MASTPPLHALVLPYPLLGHITPALQLSLQLASSSSSSSRHISITFVVTQHLLPKVSLSIPPPIDAIGVPDNLPDHHPRASNFNDSYDASIAMEPSVDLLLQKLASQNRLPNVIIADAFVFWAHELALKHGICSVALVTTNASAMVVMASLPKLIDLGIVPLKTVNGSSSEYMNEPISCIPGLPPLNPMDLPMSLRMPSITHFRMRFIIDQFKEARKAVAVIVNTVEELEKKVLEEFEYDAPVLSIGPTLLLSGGPSISSSSSSSLWQAQNDCLPWLDKQAPRSVVYIAFGSIASLSKWQIGEIGHGLEASKQAFLWVIGPQSMGNSASVPVSVSEMVPEGFMERTKGKGMVISWAPQTKVLSHPAIGGFVTHCGWNSVLESLSLGGVPMVCWPDVAEQALNAKVICEIWKVGIPVNKNKTDGSVSREEIRRVVNAVLQKQDNDMKARADELRKVVNQAVEHGTGSSWINLNKMIDIIAKAASQQQKMMMMMMMKKKKTMMIMNHPPPPFANGGYASHLPVHD